MSEEKSKKDYKARATLTLRCSSTSLIKAQSYIPVHLHKWQLQSTIKLKNYNFYRSESISTQEFHVEAYEFGNLLSSVIIKTECSHNLVTSWFLFWPYSHSLYNFILSTYPYNKRNVYINDITNDAFTAVSEFRTARWISTSQVYVTTSKKINITELTEPFKMSKCIR